MGESLIVSSESATVYRGGGRRYLTLPAACRAEARAKVKQRLRDTGDEWDDDWCRPRIDRLARFYRHQFRARLNGGAA
ncbi:hypothetical protein U5A82_17545 [Sphingobium sp. CR2-8]|uniref:hypothetical protein n=1 Tax=Sphingobium sp. CR2-8 TaxID=1306534 RepID=UPI002DB743A8|nr:hypothetical protein [Sphingobium sp. CR2-8]MEC3912214.1 hypothetical protein [Sphingobium sp. CR2-8]